ncbi:MAG: vanadium-dependent haloperoxidase [Planctomycetota bacterium]|nr:vanadium-dependent haloperoxidase [Planctomycetota bacterium]
MPHSLRASMTRGSFLLVVASLTLATGSRNARADVIADWNRIALDAIRAERTPPPRASRALAMVHAAMYDAVNATNQTHAMYSYRGSGDSLADARAAAACAAERVLRDLFPAQAGTFSAAFATSMNAIPDGLAKTRGVTLGDRVGASMLASRANDNSNATVPYTPGSAPGQWRPTPGAFAPALLPNWPLVTPFAMTSGSQFRQGPPPALTSAEYAAALNQVKELGSASSTLRTAEQTQIAHFWADGPGTETPPGHWNSIARDVGAQRGNTLHENARMLALLNIALADAAIVSWDMKYEYNLWRPVTAIREADTDANDLTLADPTWTPLISTPPFPEYTSGHSTFSATAATVLAGFFGTNDVAFTTDSDGLAGVTRSFNGFWQAAEEAGMSRIYGGIHFMFGNNVGLHSGRLLGQHVTSNFLTVPTPAVGAALAAGVLALARRRR